MVDAHPADDESSDGAPSFEGTDNPISFSRWYITLICSKCDIRMVITMYSRNNAMIKYRRDDLMNF